MSHTRLQRWYDTGATALQRLYPQVPYGYACPICRLLFLPRALESGLLSLDHAPPKAHGGRHVCITCVTCNNMAGYSTEAEMRKGDDVVDLRRGQMSMFRPAVFHIGDVPVNVAFKREGDHYVLNARLKKNRPTSFERLKAWAKAGEPMREDEFRKSLSIRGLRFDNQRARVGWLKSAYLIAFAAFGYRWAWQTHLDIVREQIQRPSEVLVEHFLVDLHDDSPTYPLCLIVQQPTELRGITVLFRRQVIFLPFDEGGLYGRLANRCAEKIHFNETMHGKEVPWPSRPMHEFDPRPTAA